MTNTRSTIAIDARPLEGDRTGVGRYLSNLVREWGARDPGVQFRLYHKEHIPEDLPAVPWIETRLLSSGSNALWTHWLLPRALREDSVDFLFSPWYVAPVAFMGDIPFSVTLHDIVFEAHPEWTRPLDRLLLRRVARRAADRANGIFTISTFSKLEIMRLYDIPEENIIITPLAVDPAFTADIVPLKERKPLVLFVGSTFNRRHVPTLIDAFVDLRPMATLLLVGKDHSYPPQHIDRRIEKANKAVGRTAVRRADALGQKELVTLMSNAAVVVYVSSYEGFGMPPLEAQSLGAPVIAADNTVAHETLGEGALYIKDPNSREELSQAIRAVLQKGEEIEVMVERGLENAKRFSWARCAEKTLEGLKHFL